MNKIFEAKNLNVYKKLLRILADYIKNVTVLTAERLFDLAAENGVKILPKDKLALAILDEVLKEEATADSMQKLQNMHFSNCPANVRPLIKGSEEHEIACWKRGDKISDRIADLINWENVGGTGNWCDKEGKKAILVDMSNEEAK